MYITWRFDSMNFRLAQKNILDVSRVLKPNGLFYLDLISGDDSIHYREFYGEEVVTNEHEKGTIQLFYNYAYIKELIDSTNFSIAEAYHVKRENILRRDISSRYHLVLKKSSDLQ